MKKNLLLLLGLMLVTLMSCEFKTIDPLEVELPDGPVSFSQQIQPIFESKCVGCHASTSPILTEGRAYSSLSDGNLINTTAPSSSELYEKVNGGHPGGSNAMTPTELALLLKWIEEGAENN